MDFIWKNRSFSGQIWPDWGNTAWADMAGLGSIGYKLVSILNVYKVFVMLRH